MDQWWVVPITMNRLLPPVVLILVVAVVYLFVRVNELAPRPEVHSGAQDEDDVEVATYMSAIHGHANKLWAAGSRGNFELAEFYLHELEEVMEELDAHHVVDDGVDISSKLAIHGFPAVERLEMVLQGRDVAQFSMGFEDLLLNCNACHAGSGYPQIRVVVPAQAPMGQDFDPMVMGK